MKYALSDNEISHLTSKHDILLPQKRRYFIETLYSHYKHTLDVIPLDETKKIIENKFPDYLETFNAVMTQRSGYMFNMFIMKKEYVNQYCQWLFPILKELEDKVDIAHYDAFNARFPGRISELLFNVWLKKNNLKGKELPLLSIGRVNWPTKIISFLEAKFFNKKYGRSF